MAAAREPRGSAMRCRAPAASLNCRPGHCYTFAIARPGTKFHLSDRSMLSNFRTPFIALATAMVLLAVGGCGNRTKELLGSADKLYVAAKHATDQGNYRDATRYYEALEARYPFSNPAKQGQLDLMYAYYRNAEPESAIDQADQFIRENPAHPRVDYAYYIKGLAQFERNPNFLERWFRADLSQRPPIDARKSFQAFQTLVERYPNSEYAADARQRMVFLRNRLASYEVYVADFYLKRGAYVGAINRCKYSIENYDGAPQNRQALEIMATSYDQLKMTQLADSTRKVLQQNYAQVQTNEEEKKSWWKFW
jgi:outer membrane protein assembly factor BamD